MALNRGEARNLIRRYYEQMWNCWDFDLADQLLAPDIAFRGSLGCDVRGVVQFKAYMRAVQLALPDFRNTIKTLIADKDLVAARLTYSGTHRGKLLGFKATGTQIEYAGAAFFRVSRGRIAEGWVLGDLDGLRRQLRGRDQS